MPFTKGFRRFLVVGALLAAPALGARLMPRRSAPVKPPTFTVDPYWPKPLPNHWIVGAVAGVAVDRHGNVWIIQRPSTLQPNETRSIWRAAPPVLEFSPAGELLRG